MPSSHHRNPVPVQPVVTTIVFRDSTDVLYSPALTHRRRRIEWPTHDTSLCKLIAQHAAPSRPSSALVARTKELLEDEFRKCDIDQPVPADDAAITYYHLQNHQDDFGPLLKLLYWRGRQQSAIYDVFEQLRTRGLIMAGNLLLPMSIDCTSESVSYLTWRLECFEGPAKERDLTRSQNLFEFQDDDFSLPLQWLATTIVRSSANIESVLQSILASKYLGDFDEAKLDEYKTHCPNKTIVCDRRAGACAPNLPGQFGFWLPHGVRTTSEDEFAQGLRACIQRFNRIEACFQEWSGLGPKDLLTEE